MSIASPFLEVDFRSKADSLAILHLKRDLQVPVLLRAKDLDDEGYGESKVTNTRFGSYPHSTLIDVPWGSQVRASLVDTGSRGRMNTKKRKRESGTPKELNIDERDGEKPSSTSAPTGFAHILPPTPETWTLSLPHRTQVVYAPDYSYILQRLRVRPGSIIIEAGCGSGSFTHAAARAVYGGGKVWGFEFHDQRVEKLATEIRDHGLDDIVHITHRDVLEEGFAVQDKVQADAVFLDLPAPWQALKHLTRNGPLNPKTAVRICTFSPCIEQVQRTVSALRANGWHDVEMVEIAAKRIEVRRLRVGLEEEGLVGVNPSAASVEEALARLQDLEEKDASPFDNDVPTKSQRLLNIKEAQVGRKIHLEGRLSHRTESELKAHTSYLVFALLPLDWTRQDEASIPTTTMTPPEKIRSQRQWKKEAKKGLNRNDSNA